MLTYIAPITINFYRLFVDGYEKCYVGSTKKKIETRLCEHKSSYNSKKTQFFNSSSQLFKYAYENDKVVKIELLENIEIKNFEDLKNVSIKENELIENINKVTLNSCVNVRKAKY